MKNSKFKVKNSRFGFTLIELLIAMTIMAILIAIGLVSYQGAKKVARDGKRKADIEQIRSALEIYRSDCKTYPATLGTELKGTNSPPAVCSTSDVYMTSIPLDPGSCLYYYSGAVNSYTLCADLENVSSSSNLSGCVNCGTGCFCDYKVTNP